MNPRPWLTNGQERLQEFAERHDLVVEDVERLYGFVRRLEIDPLDILASTDHVGERYCRIGPTATVAHQPNDSRASHPG